MATPLDSEGAPVSVGAEYVPVVKVKVIDTAASSALAGPESAEAWHTGDGQLIPLSAIGGGAGSSTTIYLPGADGEPGEMGMPGPVGATGSTGATGATGAEGERGIPGMDGADGQDGWQGPLGNTGPQGAQGPQGTIGPDGQDGMDGLPGPQGNQGRVGDQGPRGADGADGLDGERGNPGPQGLTGLSGVTIPPNDGEPGQDGSSFTATIQQSVEFATGWIDRISGSQVVTGTPGGSFFFLVDGTNCGTFPVTVQRRCRLGKICTYNKVTTLPGGGSTWRILLTVNGGFPAYHSFGFGTTETFQNTAWGVGQDTVLAAGDKIQVSCYDAFGYGDPTDVWMRFYLELIQLP